MGVGQQSSKLPQSGWKIATAPAPKYPTVPAKLIKWKSFDGLEIPGMYYRPTKREGAVPVIINVHGGPESQADAGYRLWGLILQFTIENVLTKTSRPIRDYILNEFQCAIIYPNVRGSRGYGKRFEAADNVEKRIDSIKFVYLLIPSRH